MATHKWLLEYDPDVPRMLESLPAKQRYAIFSSIRELLEADNPTRIPGVRKLEGYNDHWRQRQGIYRIIFKIESEERVVEKFRYKGTVFIVKIGNRNSVYKA
jgi:mRNA-degrading endonuclease RelE of RelBE toxin-antitoxin system